MHSNGILPFILWYKYQYSAVLQKSQQAWYKYQYSAVLQKCQQNVEYVLIWKWYVLPGAHCTLCQKTQCHYLYSKHMLSSLSFTFSYYITHITYSHCLACCNSFHITSILHGESIISIIYFYLWKYLFYRLFILSSGFLIMSVWLANCTWGCAQSYIPDKIFF